MVCRDFPNKIVIGIDARKGKVSIEGWTKDSGINANELAINAEKKVYAQLFLLISIKTV
ncbi:MAG: hypothetical protein CM15mP109_03220 [Candidatus Dadabacteria bacterium]|nr:MAG: hypothetical protein CM15mP109_03220 [Candidatus Dadabacteria bacterium]